MINAQKLECDVGGVKFYPLSYDRSVKKCTATLTRKDIADAIGYNKEFAVDKDYINKLLFVVSALNNHFKMSGSGLTAKVSSFDNYEIFVFDKDGIKAERFNETFLSLMKELNDLDLNVLLTQKSGLYVSELILMIFIRILAEKCLSVLKKTILKTFLIC